MMKGYKGFEKGLVCRGKLYAENTVFEEDKAEICNSRMHFCELPHQVFEYYSPGENHEFAKVEALDEVFTDDNRKYCTKKLRIGTKISVFDICKISVNAFFEKFDFNNKINKAKESKENNAGNYGAANAGDCGVANAGGFGAANAGNYGAANAGYCGAANAGNCGAANAGYRGAANAGDYGAANAGDGGAANAGDGGAANAGHYGAANAGDCGVANAGGFGAANAGNYGAANAGGFGAANAGNYGAANAGHYGAANAGDNGAAIVREDGSASVGKGGVAVAFGGQAKGSLGAVIVLVESDDDGNVINAKSYIVDGEKVKADTYYRLKNDRRVEVK